VYTRIAPKWDDAQFKGFIGILKDTGNLKAYEIFTADGAEFYLPREHVASLKEHMMKISDSNGDFEGLTFEDEACAKATLKYWNGGIISGGELKMSLEERREVLSTVNKFIEGSKKGVVWFNEWKPALPNNYIERRLAINMIDIRDKFPPQVHSNLLDLVTKASDKLITLVNGPGMGKSSALTKLEIDLRSQLKLTPRIKTRINLNRYSTVLSDILKKKIPVNLFITKCSSCIPLDMLTKNLSTNSSNPVPMFVLLDGLDEVLPTYKAATISVLYLLKIVKNGIVLVSKL